VVPADSLDPLGPWKGWGGMGWGPPSDATWPVWMIILEVFCLLSS
jgi:hypothetical protein